MAQQEFPDLDEGVAAAVAGRIAGIEDLPERLIAIDPTREPARLAHAERLLVRAEPRVWLTLDVAARRSPYRWPRCRCSSSPRRDSVARGSRHVAGPEHVKR